jgi:serine/threonine-protein kinase
LDFGFARFARKVIVTANGFAAGSPTHMAPEVWLGEPNIDHRADVYGLGVLLYRVLGGQPPFDGNPGELLVKATTAPRPGLRLLRPELPPEIDAWVQEALAIRREDRFARAQALWVAFVSCLTSE